MINYNAIFNNFGTDGNFGTALKAKTRPSITFEEIELPPQYILGKFYDRPIKIAGNINWEPLVLIIDDKEPYKFSELLQKQLQEQQIALQNSTNLSVDSYKFNIDLSNENEAFNIQGAFVSSADWKDLNSSEIELTIIFDYAMMASMLEG